MYKYIVLASLLLTGCISPQEMELRKKHHCANLGAPEGSKNYYLCRERIEGRLDMERREYARQIQQQQLIDEQRRQAVSQRMGSFNQPTRCRSYAFGGGVNTDCS